jgi:hypothetical protein
MIETARSTGVSDARDCVVRHNTICPFFFASSKNLSLAGKRPPTFFKEIFRKLPLA